MQHFSPLNWHIIFGRKNGCNSVFFIQCNFDIFIQISHFASCKCLSDKKEFPSFLRTTPSDAFQAIAFAQLVTYFGWLYMGTLEVNRDYGKQGIDQFMYEAEETGICIAFRKMITEENNISNNKGLGKKTCFIVIFRNF